MNITKFNEMMSTMTIKDLNSMKNMINNVIKDKVKIRPFFYCKHF